MTQEIFWNVKGATTVSGAVSEVRHGSPKASANVSKFSLQDKIEAPRVMRPVFDDLKRLACDEYYLEHGSEPYRAYCASHFKIEQRRGYVKLILVQS